MAYESKVDFASFFINQIWADFIGLITEVLLSFTISHFTVCL